MYLILVGAGPIGRSLAELALKDGHDVAIIENQPEQAERASERFDALVLKADIADGGILEEAGASRADALVATTHDDASNLMAMFLGSDAGIANLVSVVNDTRHEGLFERLGVHVLVDPEVIIAEHLYAVVRQPAFEDVVALPKGGQLFEFRVRHDTTLAGKTVGQIHQEELLPEGVSIISVCHRNERVPPGQDFTVSTGDYVTIFSQHPLDEKKLKTLTG